MARFNVGDRIRISATIASPFASLEGQIQEVQAHHRVATLDRYVVALSWGERVTFYDVQLEPMSAEAKKPPSPDKAA